MFTLERLPDSEKGPRRAYGLAGRLDDLLDGSAKEMREAGRELVLQPARRELLWTPRVWPGAIPARAEIIGAWRRSGRRLTASPRTGIAKTVRDEIKAEALALPLADWSDPEVVWDR